MSGRGVWPADGEVLEAEVEDAVVLGLIEEDAEVEADEEAEALELVDVAGAGDELAGGVPRF